MTDISKERLEELIVNKNGRRQGVDCTTALLHYQRLREQVLVPPELLKECADLFDEINEELYDATLEDRPLLSVGIEETSGKVRAALAAAQDEGHE